MLTVLAYSEEGITTLHEVPSLQLKALSATPPTENPVTSLRPVPVTVTVVPPASVPVVGLIELIVGGARYVNWSAGEMLDEPAGLVATMFTVSPTEPAGMVTVQAESLSHTELAGTPPTSNVAALNSLPVTTTVSPPPMAPDGGLTELIVGSVNGSGPGGVEKYGNSLAHEMSILLWE